MLSAGMLILLVGVYLRSANLMGLPLFIDEIFHLNRAHAIAQGTLFAGLEHDKWLYTIMLGGLFRPLGPEGPFIARYLTVLFSAITIATCVALATALLNRFAGVLAGIIYAFIPMAIFIERQALVDGTLAAFSTLSLLVTVYLVRKPRVWWGVFLAFLLTAAYLTKGTGFPFLIMPVFGVLLLSQSRSHAIRSGGIVIVAVALAYVTKSIIWEIALRQEVAFEGVLDTHNVTSAALGDLSRLLEFSYITSRLAPYVDILVTYTGWLFIFLALSAFVWLVRRQKVGAILFMLIPSIALGLATSLADSPSLSNRVEVRYLTPTVAPLVVLTALAVTLAIGQFARRMQGYLAVGVLLALLIPYLSLNHALIVDTLSAPLRPEDQQAYRDAALEAKRQVSMTIMQRETLGTPLQVVGPFDCCQPYMGPRWADYTTLTLDDRTLSNQLRAWVSAGETVYLVENTAFFVLPEHQLGVKLELIREAPMPLGQLNLYQVTGVGVSDQEASALYQFVSPQPGQLPEDEAELLAALSQREGSIWIHPSHYEELLSNGVDRPTATIELPTWPANRTDAQAAIDALETQPPFTQIDVVQVDPALTDMDRQLQLALDESLYQLDRRQIGLFQLTRYSTGANDLIVQALGIVFEEAITLEQVAWAREEVVLVGYLIWSTSQPIDDSFVIFVHVLNEAGELVAQRDAVPGNGLFPTTSWNTEFPIADRFAIQLPEPLPAGEYQMRVGLYVPASGQRLRVTKGEYADYAQAVVLTIP